MFNNSLLMPVQRMIDIRRRAIIREGGHYNFDALDELDNERSRWTPFVDSLPGECAEDPFDMASTWEGSGSSKLNPTFNSITERWDWYRKR
jgi:hypothetical protein